MRSLSMARQLITMRLDKTKVRHRQAATARRPRSLARYEEVKTLHWLGLVKPLTRDVQWIDSASPIDRRAPVNGLSSAIQWIGRRAPMDGTRRFNGLAAFLPSRAAKRTSIAAGQQGRIDDSIRRYRRKRRYRLIDPTLPWYWSKPTPYFIRAYAIFESSQGHD